MDSVTDLRKLLASITTSADNGEPDEDRCEMYTKYHNDASKVRSKIINDQSFPLDASLKFIKMDLQRALDWDDHQDYTNLSRIVDVTVKMMKAVIRNNAMSTPSKGQPSGIIKTIKKTTKGPVPGSALDIFKPKHPRPRGAAKQGMAWDYDNGVWVSVSGASNISLAKPKPLHPRPRGANKKGCIWNYDTGKWILESEEASTASMNDDSDMPLPQVSTMPETDAMNLEMPTDSEIESLTSMLVLATAAEDENQVKGETDDKPIVESNVEYNVDDTNADDDPMGGF